MTKPPPVSPGGIKHLYLVLLLLRRGLGRVQDAPVTALSHAHSQVVGGVLVLNVGVQRVEWVVCRIVGERGGQGAT